MIEIMKKLLSILLFLIPFISMGQDFMIHQKPFASSPPLSRLILLDDGAGNYTSTTLQNIINAVPPPDINGDGFVDSFVWSSANKELYLFQDGASDFILDLSDIALLSDIPAESTPYTLPTMSVATKGGARVGTGLSMSSDVLSVDLSMIAERSWVNSNDDNNYPTSLGFNSSTGILSIARNGLSTLTVDLDTRYTPGGGGSYTLPAATAGTRGGIRIGSGVTMSGDVLSVPEYSLPAATGAVRGGVKVGDNLSVSGDILSADMPQFAKQSYSSFPGVQINGSTYTDIGSRTFTVSGTNMILVKATTRAGVSESHINYRLYINGVIREQQTMANWSNVSTDNFLSLTDWEIVSGNVTIKVDAVTNDGIATPTVFIEDVEIMILPIL